MPNQKYTLPLKAVVTIEVCRRTQVLTLIFNSCIWMREQQEIHVPVKQGRDGEYRTPPTPHTHIFPSSMFIYLLPGASDMPYLLVSILYAIYIQVYY